MSDKVKLGEFFAVGIGQYAAALAAHDAAQTRIVTLTEALRELVEALDPESLPELGCDKYRSIQGAYRKAQAALEEKR